MVAAHHVLYAVEPNHGELDAIPPSGGVRRVSDISLIQGTLFRPPSPTTGRISLSATWIRFQSTFPIKDGSSKTIQITPSGRLTTIAIGFITVLGLAFDHKGPLYVLENTTGNPSSTPGTGKVVRIDGKNTTTEIATGLFLPTAMTFGPDGDLYVSNVGFGPSPVGLGQVVKITLPEH